MEDFGCDTPEFVLIFRTQVFVINLHFSSSSKFEFFCKYCRIRTCDQLVKIFSSNYSRFGKLRGLSISTQDH